MLEALVVRSRHAHARITRIDASRALALPGVRAVLTAADVPRKAVIPNACPRECGNPGLGGAVANAVCDALRDLDVAITALPITPARVFAAIHARG